MENMKVKYGGPPTISNLNNSNLINMVSEEGEQTKNTCFLHQALVPQVREMADTKNDMTP
jgi:hypothetical protein